MQEHCTLMGICRQQLGTLHSATQRWGPYPTSLISIVSDVVCDSGGRTVAWEADRLLYLETNTLTAKALRLLAFFHDSCSHIFHRRTIRLNFACRVLCHLYSHRNSFSLKCFMEKYTEYKCMKRRHLKGSSA